MGKIVYNYRALATNKYAILFLLYFVHLKFFIQIVLDIESAPLDITLYVLLLLGINYKRVKRSFLVLIPIMGISLLNPAARNIFVILLCTYITAQLPIRTILYHNILAQIIVFSLSTICLSLGITESVMFQQTALDMRVRYDYGMGNPNTFAMFVYSFIINLYLYKGIFYKRYLFIIALIGWSVFSYTGSRTFFVSVLVLLLFSCLRNLWSSQPRFSKLLLIIVPILIGVAVFYFSLNYTLYPEVNLLFTGRLDLYNRLLSSVSYSDYIFGTGRINEETIDSSYLHLIFEGGVIPLLLFMILYINLVYKANRKELAAILPLFASVFVFGLTESVLTFVLVFGNMIIWILLYKTYITRHIRVNKRVNKHINKGVALGYA